MTGARPGVYYEAGVAYGLGIPVFYCCNDKTFQAYTIKADPHMSKPPKAKKTEWFAEVAFDNNHHNFILWTNTEDLCKKLTARIEGLGFALPSAGR